jgi:hypothetical protein
MRGIKRKRERGENKIHNTRNKEEKCKKVKIGEGEGEG